ncbi:MAG: thioredoxin-like domain-containing protein [Vulcanimicrobiaceae bacterium]
MRISRRAALLMSGAALLPRMAAASGARTLEPILSYSDWLGNRPTPWALAGKVVLVDVFTFGCYNCANITPNLRTLHRTKPSSQFAIIGVHTPETPYERERANVVEGLKHLGIAWPVAIDNSSRLWDAYGIEYWPTQLIFDRTGKLHSEIIGDSQDAAVDATIAKLLG